MDMDTVDKLAKVLALNIEALGMSAANMERNSVGEAMAYNYNDFYHIAKELRELANVQAIPVETPPQVIPLLGKLISAPRERVLQDLELVKDKLLRSASGGLKSCTFLSYGINELDSIMLEELRALDLEVSLYKDNISPGSSVNEACYPLRKDMVSAYGELRNVNVFTVAWRDLV